MGEAGEAAGEQRVVCEHGADADHDGVVPRPHLVHLRRRGAPGDHQALRSAAGSEAVGGHGEFERHERTCIHGPENEPVIDAPGLGGERADADRQPRRPQVDVPAPVDARIRILDGRDDAGDAGGDHRLATGRRTAVVGAGFEGHRHRRAAGLLAGLRQRHRLGMRTSTRLREAAPDDKGSLRGRLPDHGAHGRIGPCVAQPAPGERQRLTHHPFVDRGLLGRRQDGRGRAAVGRHQPASRPTAPSPAGPSSPVSSPISSSKSFASRKLR